METDILQTFIKRFNSLDSRPYTKMLRDPLYKRPVSIRINVRLSVRPVVPVNRKPEHPGSQNWQKLPTSQV